MTVTEVYGTEVFDWHLPYEADYAAIAQTLCRAFDFSTAIDFGCGNGFILKHLLAAGKRVTAVDGSALYLNYLSPDLRPFAHVADLSQPVQLGRHDLVICTEVAEHLPPESANSLASTLAEHCEHFLVFTAAPPGQGGYHHVNEQPMSYWAEKLACRGLALDTVRTTGLRTALLNCVRHVLYIPRNMAVYVRL